MKRIVIEEAGGTTRVAIVEHGRLAEYWEEGGHAAPLVGNIYRGRVANVLPGMEAAFVDIGQKEHAYLYIDDAVPPDRTGPKGKIRDWVRNGEIRLVQVTKEAFGSKAPRVTVNVSLPGRRLVYLPEGHHVSVSRRIQDGKERERLSQLLAGLLEPGEGAIVRTLAEGARDAELAAELSYLRRRWAEALERTKEQKPPYLIYSGADLIARIVRDVFAEDVDELVVEGAATFRRIREMVGALHPALLERVTLYQGRQPLFAAERLESEIDKAVGRHVWLPSGGSLVVDQTEAMTVIDVNTGKFTGRGGEALEETATRTNLEAAREIARQLRLRNIGGIIIIDFIDMESAANRTRVVQALEDSLKEDRTAAYVVGWTRLGLVEMTRKKVHHSLAETLTRPCPSCGGRGRVLSAEEAVSRLIREVRGLAQGDEVETVTVEAHPDVAALLGEDALPVPAQVRERADLCPGTYRITFAGRTEIGRG